MDANGTQHPDSDTAWWIACLVLSACVVAPDFIDAVEGGSNAFNVPWTGGIYLAIFLLLLILRTPPARLFGIAIAVAAFQLVVAVMLSGGDEASLFGAAILLAMVTPWIAAGAALAAFVPLRRHAMSRPRSALVGFAITLAPAAIVMLVKESLA